MAVTADRQIDMYGAPVEEVHVIASGTTLYKGALCNFNSSGLLVAGTDAASVMCAGIVLDFPDGSATGNAGGTVRATIGHGMAIKLATSADATSWLGKNVFITDNETVQGATAATNDVKVGQVCKLAGSTTTAYVLIRRFGPSDVA